MKIIILKDKPKLGRAGEIKEVSDGFALNMLIPAGFAEMATPEKIKAFELKKKLTTSEQVIQEDILSKNLNDISGQVIVILRKVNEKGHLYEEVHSDELIQAIKKQTGLTFDENIIETPHHIKGVGEYDIPIKTKDKEVKFKLKVDSLEE